MKIKSKLLTTTFLIVSAFPVFAEDAKVYLKESEEKYKFEIC